MRAIRYHSTSPACELRLEDVAVPTPSAGEVVVRVRSASLIRWTGRSQRQVRLLVKGGLPRTMGSDFAGDVAAVCPGVPGVRVGEPVWDSSTRSSSARHVRRILRRARGQRVSTASGALQPRCRSTCLRRRHGRHDVRPGRGFARQVCAREWRVRRRGSRCGAGREGARRPCHGGGQRPPPRIRHVAWCGRVHRLRPISPGILARRLRRGFRLRAESPTQHPSADCSRRAGITSALCPMPRRSCSTRS